MNCTACNQPLTKDDGFYHHHLGPIHHIVECFRTEDVKYPDPRDGHKPEVTPEEWTKWLENEREKTA